MIFRAGVMAGLYGRAGSHSWVTLLGLCDGFLECRVVFWLGVGHQHNEDAHIIYPHFELFRELCSKILFWGVLWRVLLPYFALLLPLSSCCLSVLVCPVQIVIIRIICSMIRAKPVLTRTLFMSIRMSPEYEGGRRPSEVWEVVLVTCGEGTE